MNTSPANQLPYGSSVSAPAMQIPDVAGFKTSTGVQARHHLESRLDQIRAEYEQLLKLASDTALVYQAEFSFVPCVGHTYHLYRKADSDQLMLSLIEPERWPLAHHVGSYMLTLTGVWQQL